MGYFRLIRSVFVFLSARKKKLEQKWLNLEKVYVHDVYETITNQYDTIFKIVQKLI